ncbi:hypothetical protein Ppa06_28860 [Planomonospora parontospora subsp. parontospora]|uniref:Uncharacterized protein n=2 Tax=Planomonospora parontospora TaxID=58119 RepID=A0AA37F4U4_9ACTN|nr:hypothetical protein [Planomonospora parontospora]GGK67986.1 hypothetical protein GCM10010126_29300 [Planomonospora parontospora]GII09088.1 hypothetical protein Ppa06_28860 [Planomonospora parontospora subsp. parontospora]
MDLDFICVHAGRPASELTRRDVARALLSVPSGVALVALADLRRAMLAAGNPLSAAFWESARTTLGAIESGSATIGDVQRWLEATGTEPLLLTRSFFVWPEEDERGPVAGEMFGRLVAHLEELVAAGEIDPDALARGDEAARKAYEDLQEEWLSGPLPDGRVPGLVVSDEQDEELFAAWDEEEAFALDELRRILAELPDPVRPEAELRAACARLREVLTGPGYPGNVLRACAGYGDGPLPAGDEELWLAVAAGIAGPVSDLPEDDDTVDEFADVESELSAEDSALASLCAIHHADWLAAVAALARRGPGVLASPERIARLIAESDDIDVDMDEPEDLEATEALFGAVTPLWESLGVVDRSGILTPLGHWGLPRALERAWSSTDALGD